MLSLLLSFGRHIKINATTYLYTYVPLYKVNEDIQYIYCYSMQHKHINSFTLLQSDLPECQSCSARYLVPPSLKQHVPCRCREASPCVLACVDASIYLSIHPSIFIHYVTNTSDHGTTVGEIASSTF